MTATDKIIRDLQATDRAVRNAAALRLIDAKAVDAIPALTDAIRNTEHIGANGTLVYALGHFDCSSHFGLLVAVALRHEFEASLEARKILTEHDLVLQDDQLAECRRFIDSLDVNGLTEFQRAALVEIRERFFGEGL